MKRGIFQRKKCFKRLAICLSLFLVGCGYFLPMQAVFAEENKEGEWELLSSYTTYFNVEDRGRCENIAIAASLTSQTKSQVSFSGSV